MNEAIEWIDMSGLEEKQVPIKDLLYVMDMLPKMDVDDRLSHGMLVAERTTAQWAKLRIRKDTEY